MTRRQRPGAPGSRLVPGVMASSPASRTALVVGGVSLRWTPGVGDSLRRPHPAPDGVRGGSDPGAFGAVQSFPVAERSLLGAPGRQANVGRGTCGVNGRTGQRQGARTGPWLAAWAVAALTGARAEAHLNAQSVISRYAPAR